MLANWENLFVFRFSKGLFSLFISKTEIHLTNCRDIEIIILKFGLRHDIIGRLMQFFMGLGHFDSVTWAPVKLFDINELWFQLMNNCLFEIAEIVISKCLIHILIDLTKPKKEGFFQIPLNNFYRDIFHLLNWITISKRELLCYLYRLFH